MAVSLSAEEQLPQWASDLMTLTPGMIDSILYYDADASAPETRTYVIYYNQPLNHSQAGSVHFPLRALITVHRNDDPTQAVNHVLASGYSIMEAKNVKAYGDTVYAYMFDKSTFSLDDFPQWIDTLRKYPEPNQAPVRKRQRQHIRPFGITYDQWWENDTINAHAYEYQAKCELGYFDFRFDLIISDPAQAAEYNSYWKQHAGCLIDLENPYYRTLTFSPALYSATMSATQNATKPIVLIYGVDDAWTGAAVKDEFVNGTSVHKFILPAQNHGVHFTSNTDMTQCDAIRAILDGVLGGSQDIDRVDSSSLQGGDRGRLVLRNGQLLILRGSEAYDITGRKIE